MNYLQKNLKLFNYLKDDKLGIDLLFKSLSCEVWKGNNEEVERTKKIIKYISKRNPKVNEYIKDYLG